MSRTCLALGEVEREKQSLPGARKESPLVSDYNAVRET